MKRTYSLGSSVKTQLIEFKIKWWCANSCIPSLYPLVITEITFFPSRV